MGVVDIDTMEPIELPWQAIQEWIPTTNPISIGSSVPAPPFSRPPILSHGWLRGHPPKKIPSSDLPPPLQQPPAKPWKEFSCVLE